MQYQYERAQIAEDAFNVHAETGLTPRQLAEQRAELLEALKEAHTFISHEYACSKSQALDGEYVALEARDVWAKVCAAIANAERNTKENV